MLRIILDSASLPKQSRPRDQRPARYTVAFLLDMTDTFLPKFSSVGQIAGLR